MGGIEEAGVEGGVAICPVVFFLFCSFFFAVFCFVLGGFTRINHREGPDNQAIEISPESFHYDRYLDKY